MYVKICYTPHLNFFSFFTDDANLVQFTEIMLVVSFIGKDFPTLRLKASRDDILAQKAQKPDPKEALRYYQVCNFTI